MYKVIVKTQRVEYDILLSSKFTIIRGNSGSGRTKLTKLI